MSQRYAPRQEDVTGDRAQSLKGQGEEKAGGHLFRMPRGYLAYHGIARKAASAADENGVRPEAPAAVAQAAATSGEPLSATLQRKFEQSLGADLSQVRVHTGTASAEANEAVGAQAYTTGQDIHFGAGRYDPNSAPGELLLAHEVAHTVQQGAAGGGGLQTKLEVSQPSDLAEVQADQAAAAMVAGQPAQVAPAAGLSRRIMREVLGGNPPDIAPGATPNHPGTIHAAPTLADAANRGAAPAAGGESRATNVRVIAGETNPLQIAGSPTADNIYQESPTPQPGFVPVTGFTGTMAAPIVAASADNSLYINGNPTADDVQQNQIGDCYFLATLISVVSRDPGKIRSMITPNGSGGATITFFRRQVDQPNWFMGLFGAGPTTTYPTVSITVDDQLAFRRSAASAAGTAPASERAGNGHGGFQINGAQLRAGQAPKSTAWYGKVQASTMEIHRSEVYEMARWAPLMEKAYARYTQTYGQYGGQTPWPANNSPQGYANVNGGVSRDVMIVFYGGQADINGPNANAHISDMNWSPGANIMMTNQRVVNDLINLRGRADAQQPGDTNAPVMTANTVNDDQFTRTLAAIPVAQADPDWSSAAATPPVSAQTKTDVTALLTALQTWNTTPALPAAPKTAAQAAVGQAAMTAANRTRNPDLHAAARSRPIKEMLELMACIRNVGTDNSGGQRNIYGGHSYAVLSASFLSTTGVPVPLEAAPPATRTQLFPLVDIYASQVRLRNPHHGNVPNIPGGAPAPGGPDDQSAAGSGVFSMSLDQFFRTFSRIDAGVFPVTH